MNNWLEINGVRSTVYGVYMLTPPTITLPSERASFTSVPGRSGSLTELEGEDIYDDITLKAVCYVRSLSNLTAVAGFLKGGGVFRFPNRTGGFYKGRIVNQIPLEQILRGRPNCTFDVNIRCDPFFYLDSGTTAQTVARSGDYLNNPGCVPSRPVITITGSGDITLMVGQQIIDLEDVSGSITIDSVLEEAYNANSSCNEKMNGDYPVLVPGNNAISWDGSVSAVSVEPNWRTL